MSKTWKWILGIVLVLVLVGAMFAISYTWQTHVAGGWDGVRSFDRAWSRPMMGRGDDGWTNPPRMWERNDGWSHPMYDRGFVPFGGFFLLGGLVKFALFVGLLYSAYWLGRRNARLTLDPAPAASVMDASAAPEVQAAPRKRAKKASDQ